MAFVKHLKIYDTEFKGSIQFFDVQISLQNFGKLGIVVVWVYIMYILRGLFFWD